MAFYFALFNVSSINLEEHAKREQYRELKKSGSRTRNKHRCRSAEARRKTRAITAADVPNTNRRKKSSLSNASLDSIPSMLDDYRKLPPPRILERRQNEQYATSEKQSDSLTSSLQERKDDILNHNTPLSTLPNGDIRSNRHQESATEDQSAPPTAPKSSPKLERRRELTRRGSTPSCKKVTFRHDDPNAGWQNRNHTSTGVAAAAPVKSSGFFANPVAFLGRLSSDDRRRPQNREIDDRQGLDRAPPSASTRRLSQTSSPSAIFKLRTVIRKLIVENRSRRPASNWRPDDGQIGSSTTAWTPPRALPLFPTTTFSSRTSAPPESCDTPTPTPSEPPLTPFSEQIKMSFQNVENSVLELRQHQRQLEVIELRERQLRLRSNHSGDAKPNRCDQSWSTPVRRPQPIVIPSQLRRLEPAEQAISLRNRDDHSISGQPILLRRRKVSDGERPPLERSRSTRQRRPSPPSQQHPHRCHTDLRKRWSAILESAVSRGNNAGSYHPQMEELRNSTRPLPQFFRPDQSTTMAVSVSTPTRTTATAVERHHRVRADVVRPVKQNHQENNRRPLSQAEVVPQTDSHRSLFQSPTLVRRHSTVDKRSSNTRQQSRPFFGASRWKKKASGNTPKSPGQPQSAPSAEQAEEFQNLLSQIRYDENSNISFEPILAHCGDSHPCKPSSDQSADIAKHCVKYNNRSSINCYINPLFNCHSAPDSPSQVTQATDGTRLRPESSPVNDGASRDQLAVSLLD